MVETLAMVDMSAIFTTIIKIFSKGWILKNETNKEKFIQHMKSCWKIVIPTKTGMNKSLKLMERLKKLGKWNGKCVELPDEDMK